MTTQNYLIVEANLVTNNVVWDGDVNTWTPPSNSIQLIQTTTSAMIWESVVIDNIITDYVLTEQIGAGSIGFTWDGTNCVTNEPKPEIPIQPISTGTQVL